MRWSRVIGCGLLAATHHTGRVKFRIANANVSSPKQSARGAEQRFWGGSPGLYGRGERDSLQVLRFSDGGRGSRFSRRLAEEKG